MNLTTDELKKRISDCQYQMDHSEDHFIRRKSEWEKNYLEKLLLTSVNTVPADDAIPSDKVYDVAKMIFG